jgi:hypothetical protein
VKRSEAEKLLGGYATGTLTEAERRVLFEAALADQALFDALADEEALRELLADPAIRAQLLGALAPRVVPLWRRPAILGMAAGVLVAGLAGLAVLRGPAEVRTSQPESPGPAAQAPGPALPASVAAPARKVPPPVREKAAPAPLPTANQGFEAPAVLAPGGAAEAREAKRAEEPVKVEDARKVQAGGARAGAAAVLEVVPSAPAPPVPAAGGFRAAVAEAAPEPVWGVSARADGTLRVTVLALPGRPVLLLRRGPAGVAVVRPVEAGREGPRIRWHFDLRPAPGEALDLYLLNAPVADPAGLPAEGPVDGFRTRIPVPGKKAPGP